MPEFEIPHWFEPMGHTTSRGDLLALSNLVAGECTRLGDGNHLVAVEVGSWAGLSALAIAQPGVMLFCVDHWKGNEADCLAEQAKVWTPDVAFTTFCRNVRRHLYRGIFPVRCESKVAASCWPYKVDFVYIDADHRYECVKSDIAAWLPHVKSGGIICGHDYSIGFPGVYRAVNELGDCHSHGPVWWKRVK